MAHFPKVRLDMKKLHFEVSPNVSCLLYLPLILLILSTIQGNFEISLEKNRQLVMMRISHRQKIVPINVFSFSRYK
jgi:hypothetical protein